MGPAQLEACGLKMGGNSPMKNWERISKHQGRKAGQAKTDVL